MEQNQRSNVQDIDGLKRKLTTYKLTLEALKSGDTIEDYLRMKNEYQEIKTQVSVLIKEIKALKEKQYFEISRYDQQVDGLSSKLEAVSDSIEHMKQNISFILSQVNNINSVKEINDLKNTEHAPDSKTEKESNEINIHKEEHIQLNKQETTTNLQLSSSYKKLQNMINSSMNISPPLNQNNEALNRLAQKQLKQTKRPYQQGIFSQISSERPKVRRNQDQLNYSSLTPKNQFDFNRKLPFAGGSQNKVQQPSHSFKDLLSNRGTSDYNSFLKLKPKSGQKMKQQKNSQANGDQNNTRKKLDRTSNETIEPKNDETLVNTAKDQLGNPEKNQVVKKMQDKHVIEDENLQEVTEKKLDQSKDSNRNHKEQKQLEKTNNDIGIQQKKKNEAKSLLSSFLQRKNNIGE